jgi:hypothetical protein
MAKVNSKGVQHNQTKITFCSDENVHVATMKINHSNFFEPITSYISMFHKNQKKFT